MKTNVFKVLTIVLCTFLSTVSCEMPQDNNNAVDTTNPQKFTDIEANSDFNWSTAKNYTIHITGVPLGSGEKRQFLVKTADDKVIRKMNVAISEDFSINIRVQSKIETLILSWANFEKEITLGANDTINFTFLELGNL